MEHTNKSQPGESRQGRRQQKRSWRWYAFAACLAVFVVSGALLARDQLRSVREKEANAALAQQVRQAEEQLALQSPEPEEEESAAEEESGPLPQYQALYQENADFAAWLRIEGTAVDYPVMYTPDRPEYYLRRAFDGSYAISGSLFLDEACFPGSGNALVYGHNMDDGSMFAALPSYAQEDFWREHPVIQFDTLNETGTYEVIAAFYAQVSAREGVGTFPYYEYCDLREQARFEEYVSLVEEAALYDTGVSAQYGDELLTLSTCSYHVNNGRFVVVARRVEEA